MKKHEKPKSEQQPRAPAKRKGVVELTEHDLEQVQGGNGKMEYLQIDIKQVIVS